MNLIDTHAHLNDARFAEDIDDVLSRARDAGVMAIVNVGFDLESSRGAIELSRERPFLYAAAGIHPHDAKTVTDESLAELRQLAGNTKVVALGEVGLDYYYNHSSRETQQEAFRVQIGLAREFSLPLIVHDRDAHQDVLAILQQEGADSVGGVMHCFSGGIALAREFLDLGFFISLAGPVTFKNAGELPEVARYVPLDRLLVETDSPYLAPVPRRGRRNEPAYVVMVAEKIAEIRGENPERIAEITSENARTLFNLK
ncbi:MAG: TatD family hydrolase [Bacillota bacterium]|nr:TatD family hydrolase [Bacillota bacterium]MDW7684706.1 TatD family hydrolase [Bacillota bacterium]